MDDVIVYDVIMNCVIICASIVDSEIMDEGLNDDVAITLKWFNITMTSTRIECSNNEAHNLDLFC